MITKQLSHEPLELVSIDEARDHSRIDDWDDDDDVQGKLDAAHSAVQQWLNRKLQPTNMVGVTTDISQEIFLPYPPINSVTSVHVEDSEGNEVEVSTDLYKFDDVIGSIRLHKDLGTSTRLKVQYNCGYPDGECPRAVIHGIKMTFGTFYEMREDAVIGTQLNEVPVTARNIIKSFRVRSSR